MKLKAFIVALAAVSLLAAGCNKNNVKVTTPGNSNQENSTPNTTESNPTPQVSTVEITLNSLSNSGQKGKATLIAMGSQTKVIVTITGQPSGTSEPAHIHTGACPTPGAVLYPLSDVSKGASQTTVNVALSDLITQQFAINVHKSATQISTYVSCGDSSTMKINPPGSATSTPQ